MSDQEGSTETPCLKEKNTETSLKLVAADDEAQGRPADVPHANNKRQRTLGNQDEASSQEDDDEKQNGKTAAHETITTTVAGAPSSPSAAAAPLPSIKAIFAETMTPKRKLAARKTAVSSSKNMAKEATKANQKPTKHKTTTKTKAAKPKPPAGQSTKAAAKRPASKSNATTTTTTTKKATPPKPRGRPRKRKSTGTEAGTQTVPLGWFQVHKATQTSPYTHVPVSEGNQTEEQLRSMSQGAFAGYANVCGPWPTPAPAAAAAAVVLEEDGSQPSGQDDPQNAADNTTTTTTPIVIPASEEQQQHVPWVLRHAEPLQRIKMTLHRTYHVGRRNVKETIVHAYKLHKSIQALENYCLTALQQAQQQQESEEETTTNHNDDESKEACEFAEKAIRAVIAVQKLQRDAILNFRFDKLTPFEIFLRDVVRFKIEHGHLTIYESSAINFKIGQKVARCRRWYRIHMEEEAKLTSTDEQVRQEQQAVFAKRQEYAQARTEFMQENVPLLTKFGFQWGPPKEPFKKRWETFFELLKEFKQEKGHVKVPQLYKTQDGIALGTWVALQRKDYEYWRCGRRSPMNPERIEKLESIDFIWKLRHGRPKKGDARFRNKALGIAPWDPSSNDPPPTRTLVNYPLRTPNKKQSKDNG